MTSEAAPAPLAGDRNKLLGIAVAASVLHMLLMIPGYNEDGEFQTPEFVVILIISLVVSCALFLFAVPRGGATTALILSILALVSIVVFWAGLTLPFAAAGAFTAWRRRQAGDGSTLVTVALALSVLAAAALVAVIIGDATSN